MVLEPVIQPAGLTGGVFTSVGNKDVRQRTSYFCVEIGVDRSCWLSTVFKTTISSMIFRLVPTDPVADASPRGSAASMSRRPPRYARRRARMVAAGRCERRAPCNPSFLTSALVTQATILFKTPLGLRAGERRARWLATGRARLHQGSRRRRA